MYTVIADMSVTNGSTNNLPTGVNMEFAEDQVLDAAEYFYVCLTYFTAAKKWDPVYHGVTIDLHFWSGFTHAKHITL